MIENITFTQFLTATLLIETFMLFLFRFTNTPLLPGNSVFTGIAINNWYDKLGIIAVLLDIFSILIGFYLSKFLYEYLVNNNYISRDYELWKFLGLLLLIQISHDFGFYFTVIKNTKRGINRVIDEFKNYANMLGVNAVIGDSIMYLIATPLLYYFILNNRNDINIFTNLVCFYLIGYFLYQKPIIKN